MNKEFFEFNDKVELSRHLKYWSNACGDFYFNGEYELDDVSDLRELLGN